MSVEQVVNQTPKTNTFKANQVPGWALPATIGVGLVLSGGVFLVSGWSWVGWIIVAALFTLVAYPMWVRMIEGGRKGANALWMLLIWIAFLMALIPLVSIIWTVLENGIKGMLAPGFFASDMKGITGIEDRAAAEGGPVLGGIKHALTGTLMITLFATLISVPIGLLTSIWLVEYSKGGWFAKAITFLVDVMTGIPSIVAGLFAAGVMMLAFEVQAGGVGCLWQSANVACQSQGKQQMGITAAMALSVLMIPVVVRSTEEMLRVVPNELREASYALGVRKWRTIMRVVIPTAISGIASGVTLSIARVSGETAPIMLTAGFAREMNWNPFSDWMTTLPVYIYQQLTSPTGPSAPEISHQRAWGAALVLVIIVMILNLVARIVASMFAPKKSGR